MNRKNKDKELLYKDMPKDLMHYKTVVSYDIYFSKNEKSIYIYPTEYKVETLKLSQDTLEEILQLLKQDI